MTKSRLILILAVMALVLTLPSVVSAQRVPPHVFVGSATIDGVAAEDGAIVTAWIDDAEVASATIAGGSFTLVIDQEDSTYAAKAISFLLDGQSVAETATWMQGGGDEIVLTVTSAPVVPGRVVTIDLLELNDSGQRGSAILTELGPDTRVVLSISSGALETELVHIHLGQCDASLGGVDQALTSFVDGSGGSNTTVAATLDSLTDGNHAINSHEAGNPGNYTTCGNIPSSIAATVSTAWSGLNQYLVDHRGMSLYLFTVDTQGSGSEAPVARCAVEACTQVWPPLWTGEDPVAMDQPEFNDSANADMLGTLEWEDGRTQVTYNGWPLYYYFKDVAPGDLYGQYGDWFLIAPQGTLLVGGTNVDPAGAAGPGPKGDRGARGASGSKGATGDAGANGAAGRNGAAGSDGADGSDGARGARGSDGADGAAGAAGVAGAAGDDGGVALAVVALIIAIISLLGAGGVFFMRRGS